MTKRHTVMSCPPIDTTVLVQPTPCKIFKAPLIRYEQKQKDIDESWDTETLITTFDLDEIETEIEVDYWVRLN